MTELPFGFQPDDSGEPNPLASLFGAAGSQDLGAMFSQLGRMLSNPVEGPVHWELARDTARQALAAVGDPSVTPTETTATVEALRLAELWLDAVTAWPSGVGQHLAWSRSEWIEQTLPQWRSLVEPLASRVADASAQAVPDEVRTMAGPLLGLMSQMSGAMFGSQVGQGVAALAAEVVGSTDIGLPLAADGQAVLLPGNVAAFGEGLGLPVDEVRLYLAVREVAHLRLFHHAPWLASRIRSAVDDYARGISIDTSAIESALGGVDPSNPQALQDIMTSGVFEPPTTADQVAALGRLETVLALVEGWVDVVTYAATDGRLPAAAALRETLRRRRASGGPAETTFATLVGLQLRPRRLRDAAQLWVALENAQGAAGRDAVWDHPDLLPATEDLDAVDDFVARRTDGEAPLDLSSLDDPE
ncbi:MAG TPA: zinc-dependent metalloprotease [Actinomycetes bacterium]|nr:zinc-dependent metalloprotease [Actinomycetes bacterium]